MEISMAEKQEIEEIIDKTYSLDSLRKLYRNYLSNFDADGTMKLELKDVDYSQQKVQKRELVRIFTDILINPENFKRLLTILPQDVVKVFYTLTWEGKKIRAEELEKDLELKISLPNQTVSRGRSIEINSSYLFFAVEKINNFNMTSFEYRLYLPDQLREILKQYFDPPEGYNFIPLEEIETTDFLYENRGSIVKYLQLYYNYVNSGNIIYSKQDKPSRGSMKNTKEYCEIKEFYESEDKELEFLRTELIINLLKDLNLNPNENPLDLLAQIIRNFSTPQSPFMLDNLLSHIKGRNEFRNTPDYKTRNTRVKNSMISILKDMPVSTWISIDNLLRYSAYRNIFFQLFEENIAEHNLYIDEMKRTSNTYSYGQKTYIKPENFFEIVVMPLIKGVMFLFASLGIVDTAYDYNAVKAYYYPDFKVEYGKTEAGWFSASKSFVKLSSKNLEYTFTIEDEKTVTISSSAMAGSLQLKRKG